MYTDEKESYSTERLVLQLHALEREGPVAIRSGLRYDWGIISLSIGILCWLGVGTGID